MQCFGDLDILGKIAIELIELIEFIEFIEFRTRLDLIN